MVENLIKDDQKIIAAAKPARADAQQRLTGEACVVLSKKLDGFLTQRGKFQKTIDLAQEQLSTWQDANRNAC